MRKSRSGGRKPIQIPAATQKLLDDIQSQNLNRVMPPRFASDKANPDMQALRDICAGKPQTNNDWGIHPQMQADIQAEIPICGKTWWEDGDQYECLMDAGHSIPLKHGRNGMVRRVDE